MCRLNFTSLLLLCVIDPAVHAAQQAKTNINRVTLTPELVEVYRNLRSPDNA